MQSLAKQAQIYVSSQDQFWKTCQYGKKRKIVMSMCVLMAVYMKVRLSMTKHDSHIYIKLLLKD